jgi:methylenetetrahydrofolate reductase (NADPH)
MSTLAEYLRSPRYEVIPTNSAEEAVAEWLPSRSTVTITASPTKGLEPTLALAERLAARGYRPVPHLAARSVGDQVHLKEIVARLAAAGIDDVFVPGGDAKEPAGSFGSALELLRELKELDGPFRNVGITGYPESVPHISDDVTIQAMWDKRQYATYIVSNVCFNAERLRTWIGRIRARGVALPVYVGLPYPAERSRLLKLATVSGASDSVRFMTKHPEWVLRLGLPGGYDPQRFLRKFGELTPEDRIAGVHLFTFNQIRKAEEWRRSAL